MQPQRPWGKTQAVSLTYGKCGWGSCSRRPVHHGASAGLADASHGKSTRLCRDPAGRTVPKALCVRPLFRSRGIAEVSSEPAIPMPIRIDQILWLVITATFHLLHGCLDGPWCCRRSRPPALVHPPKCVPAKPIRVGSLDALEGGVREAHLAGSTAACGPSCAVRNADNSTISDMTCGQKVARHAEADADADTHARVLCWLSACRVVALFETRW